MHSNRRSFLGLGLAFAAMAALPLAGPARASVAPSDPVRMLVAYDHHFNPVVVGYFGDAGNKLTFVDGKFVVPGGEQLRGFYGNLYRPFGQHAAMQPDNGAGQVSGDRAQSVGKAGDLKAGLPGKVKSETPGGRAVDARKTSWLRSLVPWPMRPVPS